MDEHNQPQRDEYEDDERDIADSDASLPDADSLDELDADDFAADDEAADGPSDVLTSDVLTSDDLASDDAQTTEPQADGDSDESPAADDAFGLDIDAALASVASLSDVIAQREAEEAAERERQQAEARRWASYRFEHPPLATLRRGQITSLVPALLLMALGAWLTFANTTGDAPDSGLVALAILGGLGLILLLFWLQSGRWARGALFAGLTLTGAAGLMAYLTQFDGPGVEGWPLLIAVPGAAAFLSGILARPADRQLAFTGLALTAGALLMLAFTTGIIAEALAADVDALIADYGWVALMVALVLLVLPLLLRRRA